MPAISSIVISPGSCPYRASMARAVRTPREKIIAMVGRMTHGCSKPGMKYIASATALPIVPDATGENPE